MGLIGSEMPSAWPDSSGRFRVAIGPDQNTEKFGHRAIRRSVTIDGFDAEATKKELTTHLEVFRWYCPAADRTGMLVLRSPRPFKDDDIVSGPGGSQIWVVDPSGNLIELFQPKE